MNFWSYGPTHYEFWLVLEYQLQQISSIAFFVIGTLAAWKFWRMK